jgi:outer membrane receptor protein involved in Fe transport
LFTAQFSEFGAFVFDSQDDPCSASRDPLGNNLAGKCVQQGLSPGQVGVFEASPFHPTEFVSGGNPDLDPESSDTFTIGAVYQPLWLPGLTMSLDYYDLEVEDTIGEIDPSSICFNPVNAAGVFCDNLQRDESGNVSRVTSLIENRGLLATNGIDFQVQYSAPLPASLALFGEYAEFSVGAMLTHVLALEFQENIVTEVYDCAGYFGWPCQGLFRTGSGTYPENRLISNFDYDSGPFTARLSWRWIYSVDNAAPLLSGIVFGIENPVLATPRVSSWNYLDLGLAYEWDSGVQARLGINNLTDKAPPLMGDSAFKFNTDAQLYDVFGRTYFLNLRYRFDP